MEKNNLQMIINDLRSRRDALSLAHDNLEIESDNWNKAVIVISLMTGMLESIKLRMNWTSNVADLIPIAFSSIIACVSALIKFKNIPSLHSAGKSLNACLYIIHASLFTSG